jgi:hypothetical protein
MATMSQQRTAGAVAIFLLVQVLVNVLFPLVVAARRPFQWEPYAYMWMGVIFSQVSLVAFWNALGTGRLFLRTIGAILAVSILWAFTFLLVMQTYMGKTTDSIWMGVTMLIQWVVVQLPLWWLRLSSGWRVRLPTETIGSSERGNVQFGIKHLLFWTTIVGVFLGLGRFLLSGEGFHSHDAIAYGLLLVFDCLFAWPTLLAGIATRRPVVGTAISLLFTIVITAAETYIFSKLLGGDDGVFWGLNSAQFIWMAGSTLVLRYIGFQLVRQ